MHGLREVVLVEGRRTPFQRAATGYRDLMSYQLAAAAIAGALDAAGLGKDAVERVILGATVHNPRTTNVAREAALAAGIPPSVPAMTVTAAGASATAAVSQGIALVAARQADVVVAGGTDCVSDPPIGFSRAMRKKLLGARRLRGLWPTVRFLASLRPWDFLPDMPDLTELSTGLTMGEYTEELARRLKISREDQDAYAVRSHQRAAAARAAGHLAAEIAPVSIPEAGVAVREDNGIRPRTSVEQLARLHPSFDRQGGTLSAGNSTFLTDGAAVVVLMSAERAESEGRAAKAVFRGDVMTAHDPHEELLLGPVYAVPRALAQAGIALGDVDVVELHEAFAAQVLAVERLWEEREVGRVDGDKLNAWGGSLAIGNPFAPNGARLLITAANRLRHEDGRYAVVATCAGGALGHAFVLERGGLTPGSIRSAGPATLGRRHKTLYHSPSRRSS